MIISNVRIFAGLVLAAVLSSTAQAATPSGYITKVIDGNLHICHYDLFSRLVCRPVEINDVVCIPDPYSGDGTSCHEIDLHKGFRP